MFVGLDIHKKHNQACVMDAEGEVIKEERFLNTKEELDKFLEDLPDNSKIVMEACSVWEPIFEELDEHGFEVHLAHPSKVRIIASARVKNDKIDAKKLCSYAGVTASVYQSGEKTRYGHMTKQGNSLLRWILVQAIPKTVRRCEHLKSFHARLEHKKGANVAKVASARKLLVYMYIMLTHNIKFGELRVNSV